VYKQKTQSSALAGRENGEKENLKIAQRGSLKPETLEKRLFSRSSWSLISALTDNTENLFLLFLSAATCHN
jgi:hypothetical protein